MEHVNGWCFRGIYKGGLWEDDLHVSAHIHGYIVYMFVYTCILDIWVRVYMYILNFFFNFSYLVTIYPVNALHFT